MDGKCSSGMGARWMGDVVMGWKVRSSWIPGLKKELMADIRRY